MSYVDKVLQPGEVVVGRTRLHWFIYLHGLVILVLALIVFVAGTDIDANLRIYADIVAGLLGLVALWRLLGAWIRRLSTEFAVTNRRVIHKQGLISRQTQEMNRDKVESIDVDQSVTGRIFGYGTVLVRGIGSTWEPFPNVADPLTFRSHITAS